MKTNFFKSTIMVAAFVASCFGGMKAFQSYNSVGSNLLMDNVEALSKPETYTGWAKDYEVGSGLYVVRVTGSAGVEAGFSAGMRFNGGVSAAVQASLVCETFPEYKKICQYHMGCYYSCDPEDWHKQDPKQPYSAGLDRGCD
jgi:hypothetical protein